MLRSSAGPVRSISRAASGRKPKEPTGVIPRDLDQKPSRMNRSAKSLGMIRRLTRNGQENVCRPKRNGNTQRAAGWCKKSIRGEMTCGRMGSQLRIGGKEVFQIEIQ